MLLSTASESWNGITNASNTQFTSFGVEIKCIYDSWHFFFKFSKMKINLPDVLCRQREQVCTPAIWLYTAFSLIHTLLHLFRQFHVKKFLYQPISVMSNIFKTAYLRNSCEIVIVSVANHSKAQTLQLNLHLLVTPHILYLKCLIKLKSIHLRI